jgi:hypothetical protein
VDDVLAGLSFIVKFNLGAKQLNGSDGSVLDVEQIAWPKTYDFPLNDIVFLKLRTSTKVAPVSWNRDPLIPKVGDIGTAIGLVEFLMMEIHRLQSY